MIHELLRLITPLPYQETAVSKLPKERKCFLKPFSCVFRMKGSPSNDLEKLKIYFMLIHLHWPGYWGWHFRFGWLILPTQRKQLPIINLNAWGQGFLCFVSSAISSEPRRVWYIVGVDFFCGINNWIKYHFWLNWLVYDSIVGTTSPRRKWVYWFKVLLEARYKFGEGNKWRRYGDKSGAKDWNKELNFF